MKKGLLTVGAFLALTISMNAQILTNGGFELPFTEYTDTPGSYDLLEWFGLENAPETNAPHSGNQNLKLTTTNDPTLNNFISYGTDKIAGQITYEYTDQINNPADYTLSFWYKYTSIQNDSAYVGLTIYDTLGAGIDDDLVLYWAQKFIPTSVSNWTNENFTLTYEANGTPNKIEIFASSSVAGTFNKSAPKIGSTLRLDDFELTNPSNTNINNTSGLVEKSISKFNVYPNPTTDYLNFNSIENNSIIEISSVDGKIISNEKNSGNSATVKVSNLTNGVYIYKLTNEKGETITNKFIKK